MDKQALIIAALLFVLIVGCVSTYAYWEASAARVPVPEELRGR